MVGWLVLVLQGAIPGAAAELMRSLPKLLEHLVLVLCEEVALMLDHFNQTISS